MTRISHSIVIERPVSEVFNFVTNFENDHYWWKAVSYTRMLTDGPIGEGSEFEQVASVMFVPIRNSLTITSWLPPHSATYTNNSKQLAYELEYRFTPDGQATRFDLNATLAPKGILHAMLPLTMKVLHSQLDKFFGILKHHLESQPAQIHES